MPTNQEWLHKLANESPDELKAWFDAEHNGNLAAEKVVSGDAANSNDGNAHLKASEDLSDGFTDSRTRLVEWAAFARTHEGELINEVHVKQSIIDSLSQELDDITDERNMLQRRNDELRTSYDKLKRERDNLAADLLACNREREQLRKHLGIALDHAHDICALVDIGE